ncbi:MULTISPECIES: phage major tropism determinant [unclassified Rhizobium]
MKTTIHPNPKKEIRMNEIPRLIPAAVSVTPLNTGAPILMVTGRSSLSIKAGTVIVINGKTSAFETDTPVRTIEMTPARDYAVTIDSDGAPFIVDVADTNPLQAEFPAGFHFAPGGCAEARVGGDNIPAINPHSVWDLGFRPACADPRGMALVEADNCSFWCDIYLLGVNHRHVGTSVFGAEIADGQSLDLLDYKTASAIYEGHGKRLLTYAEFHTAAYGVTERSSAPRDPKNTGLDASRTSRFGLMQATGNLWVWGTDGDPDDLRPSIFGGSWFSGVNAGSRCADLDFWPENSKGSISARGACDHLAPV